MAFVNKAVKKDNMITPTRTQIIPNTRPRNVFGVSSNLIRRKKHFTMTMPVLLRFKTIDIRVAKVCVGRK